MTYDEERCSEMVIEWCRKHLTKLGRVEFAKMGVRSEDTAIAACYSAFDLASAHKGDPFAGLEFARTALDVIERSLLTKGTVQ